MNRNFFYPDSVIAFVIFAIAMFIILVLLSTGCAGKGLKIEVETEGPGANQTKKVKIETDYQVENGFKLTRNTVTGDYEIDLGSATTKDADAGVFMLLSQMLEMMRSFMIPGGAPPAPPASVPPALDSVP